MRKRLLRIAARTLLVLGALAAVFVIVVLVRSRRTFDAPYPNITASTDPQVIERGRYLAYGPAHCVNCHTTKDQDKLVDSGAMPALAGGRTFKLPLGNVYSRNLTPDKTTGIGRYTDREVARVLRYGVKPDGRAVLPFMEMQNLSDEDLTALVSFLRSQQPVKRAAPEHDLNIVGKAVLAFVIKPVGPSRPLLAKTPAEGTLARGEYIATSVANCAACHTRRNLMTGQFVAASFSGGMEFRVDESKVIVSPNLTPARAGRINTWSEEQFVGRFGAGVGIPGTHMPWRQFQRMSDADVRSVFRYLRTLKPVEHDPGPTVQVRKPKSKKS